jgi:hypothetical protein
MRVKFGLLSFSNLIGHPSRRSIAFMAELDDKTPPRLPVALRVGVTGARRLRADQLERIGAQTAELLGYVRAEMDCLNRNPVVSTTYRCAPEAKPEPWLRILSPLALCADRVVAQAALDHGYDLHAVLPFTQAEYEKDFTGSREDHPEEVRLTAKEDCDEFRELLALAETYIALDGARDPKDAPHPANLAAHSYEVAGRFVVRHSDIIIAIWDGCAGNGRGGTAEIVRYAAGANVPIWWIHATDATKKPAWIAGTQDLRDVQFPCEKKDEHTPEDPKKMLREYLCKLIHVPERKRPPQRDLICRLVYFFNRKRLSPVEAYYSELPRRPRRSWKTYSVVLKFASRKATLPEPQGDKGPSSEPTDPIQKYWYDLQKPAGSRAGDYAARYRSGYVLVILLATLALVVGGLAVGLGASSKRPVGPATVAQHAAGPAAPAESAAGQAAVAGHVAEASANTGQAAGQSAPSERKEDQWAIAALITTCLELLVLLCLRAMVSTSALWEWHEKSVDYRILAELFRKQQMLSAVGWALPFGSVDNLRDMEGLSWVCWLFAAAQRAAPLPQGDVTNETQHLPGLKAVKKLIVEQMDYHSDRHAKSHAASSLFERYGSFTFGLVLICVGMKLFVEGWWHHQPLILAFGLAATVLPGVSAAFVGLRSYAEWQLLAEQSHHMTILLRQASKRVDRLCLTRPSVSQDLGAEALTVATIMLQDVEGWGRLFRGKAMEA